MDSKEQFLHDLYYKPGELGSVGRFYRRNETVLKERKITKAYVKRWLEKQEVRQVFKRKRKKEYYSIIANPPVPRNNYQMDLMDWHQLSRWNKGYKWMMVNIDVYSRYVMVVPMKKKNDPSVVAAYRKITERMGITKNLTTDLEPAVMGAKFQKLLEGQGTKFWATDPQFSTNTGMVERMNRTIRMYMREYFKVYKTKNWIDHIDELIRTYNNDRHRMIKAKPIDVWQGKQANNQVINRPPITIKIGDQVRFLKKYEQFTKISDQKVWSKNVYTVVGREGKRFKILKNSDNKTVHWKSHNDLQVVKGKVGKFEPPMAGRVPKAEVKKATAERRLTRRMAKEGIAVSKKVDEPRQLRKRVAKPVIPKKAVKKVVKKAVEKKPERYEVEKLVGFKKVGSSHYYKVRWKGYGESADSWEPRKDLMSRKYGVGKKRFGILLKQFRNK